MPYLYRSTASVHCVVWSVVSEMYILHCDGGVFHTSSSLTTVRPSICPSLHLSVRKTAASPSTLSALSRFTTEEDQRRPGLVLPAWLDGAQGLALVLRQLRVPNVHDEDEAVAVGLLPHLVLEGVVKD